MMASYRRRCVKNIAAIMFLLIGITIVFHKEIFFSKTFIDFDIVTQNYPRMAYVRDRLLHGEVPLWTPYIYAGYPIAAEGQTGVFYPMSLMLLLMPPQLAPTVMILTHFFLAGLFMWLLCRFLRLSQIGSLLGAIVYTFNCYMFVHIDHVMIIYTLSWLPILILITLAALHSTTTRDAVRYGILGGTVGGIMVLAGHPQVTSYALVALGVICIYVIAAGKVGWRIWVPFGAVCLLVAAGITAVQMLPEMELLGYSVRGKTSYDYFTQHSLHPKMLITLLLPHFWGAPWDKTYWAGSGYVNEEFFSFGFLPLIFGAFAIFHRKLRGISILFIALAVFSLIWSMGSFLPTGKVFYYLSVLNIFRIPSRILCIFVLSGGVLCGIGYDGATGWKISGKIVRLAVAGAVLMFAASAGIFLLHGKITPFLAEKFSPHTAAMHPAEYYSVKADSLMRLLEQDIFTLFISLAVFSLFLFSIRRQSLKHSGDRASPLVSAIVIIFFTASAAVGASSFVNCADRAILGYRPAALKMLRAHTGMSNRIYATGNTILYYAKGETPTNKNQIYRRMMESFDRELPLLYKLYSINGYGSLSLWNFQMLVQKKKYVRLLEEREKYNLDSMTTSTNAGNLDAKRDRAVLDMLKVRYFIQSKNEGASLALNDLRPNRLASPLWIECEDARANPPEKGGFDPAAAPRRGGDKSFAHKVSRPSSNRILIYINMGCAGNLVTMESFYPGWTALDIFHGKEQRLDTFERFGGIGVKIQPGEHKIKLIFSPGKTRTGMAISLATLAFALAGFLLTRRGKNARTAFSH